MRINLLLWFGLLCTMVSLSEAAQPKRVALVIGNSQYQTEGLPKLTHPDSDAKDISQALRRFGFDVIEKHNVSLQEMSNLLADFGRKSVESDATVFYFGGHGLQVKGQNYLVPVNAQITSEASVPFQSVNVAQVLEELDNAKSKVNIVMLDASRNNSLIGKFRSVTARGLAVSSSVPKGTIIVYSTEPGNTALDVEGHNSVFAGGLLSAFNQSTHLTLQNVLLHTSNEVERVSKGVQVPYVNGPLKLQGEFCFAGCTQQEIATQPSVSKPEPNQPEQTLWAEVSASKTKRDYLEYLRRYPDGKYAPQAKLILRKLDNSPSQSQSSIEYRDWESALQKGTIDGFESYLKLYPAGAYADFARSGIERLKREMDEKRQQKAYTMGKKQAPVNQNFPFEPEMVEIPNKGYEIGRYEVTQAQWRAIMGNNPSKFQNCGDQCPVEQVSWDDVQKYLERLNAKTGKHYRLPIEGEWIFACNEQRSLEYCGGNDVNLVGWHKGNSDDKTHPVGSMKANEYGLYDMSGNVWEWQKNGPLGDSSSYVIRGGGFNGRGTEAAAKNYYSMPSNARASFIGFRLARTIPY